MAVRVSIGEFSTMTRLSRKALCQYDEAGLLHPAQADPASGRRHYDTSQVQTAQVIRYFCGLGMPLGEVKAVLTAPDVQIRNEIIAAHLGRMESELDKIREAISALRGLLDPAQPPIQVEFRSVPTTRAAAITATVRIDELTTWWRGAVDELDSALVSSGVVAAGPPAGVYARELCTEEIGPATVFVPVTTPVRPSGRVRTTDIPPAELAVTVHDGPRTLIGRTYGALGTFVTERLLGIDGPVRETYLVTAANANSDGQQRTEICWPIYRTAF
jgi:DNA-binding transcriptional MerR regulator